MIVTSAVRDTERRPGEPGLTDENGAKQPTARNLTTKQLRYGATAKLCHWLIVALLMMQFPIGWFMPDIHRRMKPGDAMTFHISFLSFIAGTTIGSSKSDYRRGAALGNVLNARGPVPAVILTAAAECLFNDNRVEARLNKGQAGVILATDLAIVSANRVRGGERSIEIVGATAKTATVLGNLTTNPIVIQGGLAAWANLNVIA